MRELLEVLQAAGLGHPQPGHFGHGRRLQLLPPVSPQPAPRQGSGGCDGAGRRQRGDVEQQHLGEATTICTYRPIHKRRASKKQGVVRQKAAALGLAGMGIWEQRKSSEEQMLDMTSRYCTAARSALTFGHGGRCSAPERGDRNHTGDGWNQILRVAVPEARGGGAQLDAGSAVAVAVASWCGLMGDGASLSARQGRHEHPVLIPDKPHIPADAASARKGHSR